MMQYEPCCKICQKSLSQPYSMNLSMHMKFTDITRNIIDWALNVSCLAQTHLRFISFHENISCCERDTPV